MTKSSNRMAKRTHRNMKVRTNHVIRYIPSACESSSSVEYAVSTPLPGIKIVAYDSQKAP